MKRRKFLDPANISLETGRSPASDPASRSVPGDVETTRMLRRAYREPWHHPAAGARD